MKHPTKKQDLPNIFGCWNMVIKQLLVVSKGKTLCHQSFGDEPVLNRKSAANMDIKISYF